MQTERLLLEHNPRVYGRSPLQAAFDKIYLFIARMKLIAKQFGLENEMNERTTADAARRNATGYCEITPPMVDTAVDVYADALAKRIHQEAQVRKVNRVCRGAMLIPNESVRKRFSQELETVRSTKGFFKKDVTYMRGLLLRIAAVANVVASKTGNFEDDYNQAFQILFGFKNNCGADFNDIICANDFDGKEHTYVCPRCGQAGVYIAPIFN